MSEHIVQRMPDKVVHRLKSHLQPILQIQPIYYVEYDFPTEKSTYITICQMTCHHQQEEEK